MAPSGQVLTTRGYVHILLGNFTKAIEDCTRALVFDPSDTLALYNRYRSLCLQFHPFLLAFT
jgi:tetratricopeptide (TPR) repeat protein